MSLGFARKQHVRKNDSDPAHNKARYHRFCNDGKRSVSRALR